MPLLVKTESGIIFFSTSFNVPNMYGIPQGTATFCSLLTTTIFFSG